MARMARALVLPVAMAAALLLVATVFMEGAAAATYTVGAPDGLWDMQTDYAQWVKTKTFHPGDKITFTYSAELHDVVEVSRAGYEGCSSANNISASRTGNDVVALTAVGARYFLCGLTGHCDSGMKIRVDVVAAASAAPGPASSASSSAPSSCIIAGGVVAAALHLMQHAVVAQPLWW
ncbi:hypothetical protein HU200_028601 [Digitaria exilis]|uniref:Phytocyanin domain-containing protein n=1 Tax=Digitaria exilis TaxID=1010633 RepID=A0A835ESN5_9POAL|nr:hypothetical protein HU200_028601 [Digitaria exilis]CAB3482073.1 unnamed protein product [Digitaria exilis]